MKYIEPTTKEMKEMFYNLRKKGYDPFLKGSKGKVKLGFYKQTLKKQKLKTM